MILQKLQTHVQRARGDCAAVAMMGNVEVRSIRL
jgi:hypothetical protein